MARKKVTVKQFIDAIRKNGLPKTMFTEFRTTGKGQGIDEVELLSGAYTIGSACAMGQGMINLGIKSLPVRSNKAYNNLYATVSKLNDATGHTIQEIADIAEQEYKGSLSRTMTFEEFDYTPYLPDTFKDVNP